MVAKFGPLLATWKDHVQGDFLRHLALGATLGTENEPHTGFWKSTFDALQVASLPNAGWIAGH